LRPWRVVLVALALLLVVAAIAAYYVLLVYDALSPGDTRQVNDLVAVRNHDVFPPHGQVLFTTVSVRERVNVYEILWAKLHGDYAVVRDIARQANLTPQQLETLNRQEMQDSQLNAKVVALHTIGIDAATGEGANVVAVFAGQPAEAVLKPGDVITAVDGNPTALSDCAARAIHQHRPGDHLRLTVRRGGTAAPADVDVALADQGGRGFLGVQLATRNLKTSRPVDVNIESGNVVGPSAGLAFSLELLDQLTPGELTGGTSVAATGELSLCGEVLPIGGIEQKIASVKHSGASVFLVPRGDYAEAKAHAGNRLKVYAVDTFDDALRVLAGLPGSNAAAIAGPAAGR